MLFSGVTALPLLAAPSAVASLVEVVQSTGSGEITTATGDLVTPDVPLGLSGESASVVLSIGGRDASLDIGPIFAEVDWYISSLPSVALNVDGVDSVVWGGQSAGSELIGESFAADGSAFPSGGSLVTGPVSGRTNSNTGTLEGNTNNGSGTIEGAVPGASVVTIDGTLGPSPVPLPGTAVLFATGAAAASWMFRRRDRSAPGPKFTRS